MSTWTPLQLFAACCLFAAVAAIGALLLSEKDLTWRSVLATLLFHGAMGGGMGMASYEYFELQATPWTSLAIAIAYGGGVISLSEIRKVVPRVLRSLTQEHPNDK